MSFFIALEGGECAGKSTQIQQLADWFDAQSVPHLITREPGGTPLGEAIRAIFLSDDARDLTGLSEALLMLAQRRQHLDQVILPALAAGKVVVSDRFYLSTLVYQGYGRGVDIERLRALTQEVLGEDFPDLTLVLDVPVSVSQARLQQRGAIDRLEQSNLAFFETVQRGFLVEADRDRDHIRVIDASESVTHSFNQIQSIVAKHPQFPAMVTANLSG